MKKPKTIRKTVSRTRNANTMTENQFWQMVRAALRNRTMYWIPKRNCIIAARRPSQNKNRRLKWEYQCFSCKQWFIQEEVEAHHSIEAGSLKSYEDLPDFVRKLFAEEGWICLCKQCHTKIHEKEKIIK